MTNGIERNTIINHHSRNQELQIKREDMTAEVRTLPFYCATPSLSRDDDDYLQRDTDDDRVNSPTDNSEDSVEVKVSPISGRNKRKCAEPRRVKDPAYISGPLKKRMCLQVRAEALEQQQKPFRPWSVKVGAPDSPKVVEDAAMHIKSEPIELTNAKVPQEPSDLSKTKPVISTVVKSEVPNDIPSPRNIVLPTSQTTPLFLFPTVIEQHNQINHRPMYSYFRPPSPIKMPLPQISPSVQQQPIPLLKRPQTEHTQINSDSSTSALRVPIHPSASASMNPTEADKIIRTSVEAFPRLQATRKEQRNYKNMTRERRIEANARERTRVHTISAAFDTLRRSVPAYSHSQKLSKLSILRIACSYIMTLSNMVEDDKPGVAECVDSVTRTIQREGKLRKKKDESD